MAGRQRGMTLLEMLVVLMIAGMALALGFQSLGQWRRAETAITGLSGQARQVALTQAWVTDSLRSLVPVESAPFSGSASELRGTSINAVLASRGGNTDVHWSLSSGTSGEVLTLVENGQTLSIPLADTRSAVFSYVDPEGKPHDRWPPALGVADNLPAAITLQLTAHDGSVRLWAAAIAGMRNPLPLYFEPEVE